MDNQPLSLDLRRYSPIGATLLGVSSSRRPPTGRLFASILSLPFHTQAPAAEYTILTAAPVLNFMSSNKSLAIVAGGVFDLVLHAAGSKGIEREIGSRDSSKDGKRYAGSD